MKSGPASLDIAASREGNKLFLHVGNMNYSGATEASFALDGFVVTGGRVLEIALEHPRQEIGPINPDVFKPREHTLAKSNVFKWRFSVSAVELECNPA